MSNNPNFGEYIYPFDIDSADTKDYVLTTKKALNFHIPLWLEIVWLIEFLLEDLFETIEFAMFWSVRDYEQTQ